MRVFKYGLKGLPNSVPAYSQVPRTTMIVACDSLGNVYISAAQTNSCSSVFQMYMRFLVLKLEKEDSNWREKSVIVLDGASCKYSQYFY